MVGYSTMATMMMMSTNDDDDDVESQFSCDNAESVSVVFGNGSRRAVCDANTIVMNIFFPLVFISSFLFFSTVKMASSTSSTTIRYSVSFEGFHFACEWNSRFIFFSAAGAYTWIYGGKPKKMEREKNVVSKIFAHPLLGRNRMSHELVIIANAAAELCRLKYVLRVDERTYESIQF